jgi:SpoIIAA-like
MPATFERSTGNIFRMDISGRLTAADFALLQRSAVVEIEKAGKIRLLVMLNGFDGWAPGGNWQDLGFYIRHANNIERIAIVGEERWRSESLMFVGADLRQAPVSFFPAAEGERAAAWLAR